MKKFIVYFAMVLFTFSIVSLSYSIYKKREFESLSSGLISEILSSNRDLSLSVEEYGYSIFGMQPSIIGIKIKNTRTLAEIKIDRIDISFSDNGNGDFDIKYNIRNISINDKVVYKGVDLTKYSLQKNVFNLMSGDGDRYVNVDVYGKTSYRNGGKRIATQNVIDIKGVFKLSLKTDVSDFYYIESDVIKAVFGGDDRVFYKTLGRFIGKVSFINTALSLESDNPEKIYYDFSELFLSMDGFDAKRKIAYYEKEIGGAKEINSGERFLLKSIIEKIGDNAPIRVNFFINSDYKINDIIDMLKSEVDERLVIQKKMDVTYSVD